MQFVIMIVCQKNNLHVISSYPPLTGPRYSDELNDIAAVNKDLTADTRVVISQTLIWNNSLTIIFHGGCCAVVVNHLPISIFTQHLMWKYMYNEWNVLWRTVHHCFCSRILLWWRRQQQKRNGCRLQPEKKHLILPHRRQTFARIHAAFSGRKQLEIAPNFLCKYHWLQRQISLSLCVLCSLTAVSVPFPPDDCFYLISN